jgi:hypothetical protein
MISSTQLSKFLKELTQNQPYILMLKLIMDDIGTYMGDLIWKVHSPFCR